MNIKFCASILGIALAGCGGGKGGSDKPPVPPATPTMTVVSGDIARYSAAGRGLAIEVSAQAANFTPAGTLYANASDTAGIIQKPVAVVANPGGAYTFTVDTLASVTAGHYKGSLVLKLCSDAVCNTPQSVPSISVPYDITILTGGEAWPGGKLTPLAPWTDVPDWSTFQGNASHTGYVAATLNPDKFTLRWKIGALGTTDVSFYGYNTTLSAANGLFYAASDNRLKARKEFDGSEVWTVDVSALQDPSVNPPAVTDGIVYMAAGQQSSTFMFGFDAATGAVRFKSAMSSQWDTYLAPTPFGGAVYANAGTYGGLYAFNSTGEQIFYGSLSQNSMWSPSVDANSAYAYVGDSLTIFDRKTGVVLNKIVDTQATNQIYQVNGAAVLGAPGTAYAAYYANAFINPGAIANSLMKFDTVKGIIDWRIKGNYPVTPAYASGVLYAPNTNPYRIEARAETDGALRWSWTSPAIGDSTWDNEPLVTKNLLFASTGKTTYAIDLRTQKVVWSYPAAGKLALSQNGILYIQNKEALVAINVK